MNCRNGYVTVFYAVVMGICLSLCLTLISGVRENALRDKATQAAEISIQSGFAEYEKTLWDRYKIIFADAGYGGSADSTVLPEEHLVETMNMNFDEKEYGSSGGKDLLSLNCEGADTVKMRLATDNGGKAVRAQAVRYMKYRYKISYLETLYTDSDEYDELTVSSQNLEEVLSESSVGSLPENSEVGGISFSAVDEMLGQILPDEGKLKTLSILKTVFGDTDEISKTVLDKGQLVTGRQLNCGNYDGIEDKTGDKLFFCEYLMLMDGNYLNQVENSALRYETEYLIAGKTVDGQNLEAIAERLLLLREAANCMTLMEDQERMKKLETISMIAASLIGAPESYEGIEAALVLAWSYIESISDIRALFDGKKVPVIKTAEEWETDFKLSDLFQKEIVTESDKGMSYEDYLRSFLYMTDVETLTGRLMDLMEINVKTIEDNDKFRLDSCFDAWGVTAYVKSSYGYDYSVSVFKDVLNW